MNKNKNNDNNNNYSPAAADKLLEGKKYTRHKKSYIGGKIRLA